MGLFGSKYKIDITRPGDQTHSHLTIKNADYYYIGKHRLEHNYYGKKVHELTGKIGKKDVKIYLTGSEELSRLIAPESDSDSSDSEEDDTPIQRKDSSSMLSDQQKLNEALKKLAQEKAQEKGRGPTGGTICSYC